MAEIKPKTFNGWEYAIAKEGGLPNITPGRPAPKTLFKYYGLSDYNIKAFIGNYFYASQQDDFNDIFDSANHSILLSNIKFEEVQEFLEMCKELHPEYDWVKIWNKNPSHIHSKMINNYWVGTFAGSGLLSMAGNSHNELMWAHYTNNMGFMVEYDYSGFDRTIFLGPIPINYCSKYEGVEFDSLKPIDGLSHIIWCTYKKDIWAYENEYRFIIMKSGDKNVPYKLKGMLAEFNMEPAKDRYESYDPSCVKSITFGYNFLKGEKFTTAPHSEGRTKATVTFKPDGVSNLKSQLLDHILTKKIPCSMAHVSKFVLTARSMEIEKEGENVYSIIV